MGQELPAGVLPSAGQVIHPGTDGLNDSVDEDDGVIDGSGLDGHSFFDLSGPAGITFKFDLEVFGSYPTMVGVVWTDGGGATSFEAFDAEGESLGGVGPVVIADESISGTTGEDHFFGTRYFGGISAIKIKNEIGGIEVDHLQFNLR